MPPLPRQSNSREATPECERIPIPTTLSLATPPCEISRAAPISLTIGMSNACVRGKSASLIVNDKSVDAYRKLKMTDLAANAEKVYTANYPANTADIAPKKHWWSFF